MRLTIDPLSAGGLHLELGIHEGGASARVLGDLEFGGVSIVPGPNTRFDIGRGHIRNLQLELVHRGVHLRADEAELPGGATIVLGERIEIPELEIPEATIEIDDVVAAFRSRRPDQEETRSGSAEGETAAREDAAGGKVARAPLAERFDFRFLDQLKGHLHVDLELDIKVPVLGRRTGTHLFRVPIHAGTINYRELERNLAALEDAIIDVEHRADRLVLERDVPLIPWETKALLSWPLDEEEQALAAAHEVRLRTLLNYEVPPPKPVKEKKAKKKRTILAVAARNVDVSLVLGETEIELADRGRIRLGGGGSPAVGELRVVGEAHHESDRAVPLPATRATPYLHQFQFGLERVGLGRSRFHANGMLRALEEVVMNFRGFVPNKTSGVARGLRLENVLVELGAGAKKP